MTKIDLQQEAYQGGGKIEGGGGGIRRAFTVVCSLRPASLNKTKIVDLLVTCGLWLVTIVVTIIPRYHS